MIAVHGVAPHLITMMTQALRVWAVSIRKVGGVHAWAFVGGWLHPKLPIAGSQFRFSQSPGHWGPHWTALPLLVIHVSQGCHWSGKSQGQGDVR